MLQKIKQIFSETVAKIRERKVIRSHIILVIEGRLLLTLLICGFAFATYMFAKFCVQYGKEEPVWFLYLLLILAMDACQFYVCKFFWWQAFEKLVVTKDYIEWRCLFLRSVRLKFSDIKHIDFRVYDEGNVMYNSTQAQAFNITYEFLLLSPHELPRTRIDKIKSSRENQIIKFRVTRRVCAVLSEMYPEPRNRIFASKLRKYPKLILFDPKKWKKRKKNKNKKK